MTNRELDEKIKKEAAEAVSRIFSDLAKTPEGAEMIRTGEGLFAYFRCMLHPPHPDY